MYKSYAASVKAHSVSTIKLLLPFMLNKPAVASNEGVKPLSDSAKASYEHAKLSGKQEQWQMNIKVLC